MLFGGLTPVTFNLPFKRSNKHKGVGVVSGRLGRLGTKVNPVAARRVVIAGSMRIRAKCADDPRSKNAETNAGSWARARPFIATSEIRVKSITGVREIDELLLLRRELSGNRLLTFPRRRTGNVSDWVAVFVWQRQTRDTEPESLDCREKAGGR